jgi:glutamate decarboxylase
MVSGGTLANITALWCARNASLAPRDDFAGIAQDGMSAALAAYGYRSAVIIGSNLMHYSFDKAADVLGLGDRNLIKVPATQRHQIDLSALRRLIADCNARRQKIIALVGIAGTTETGNVDPLADMAEIAHENGIHFHVDAAWGGPLLFSARHRNKLFGIERADSVTFDGHKQLYLPMGVGMVAFRNPLLAQNIEKHARYVIRAKSADLGKRSLEGSRPAMALFVHAALHIFGQRGYELLVDEGIRKTRYMADAIQARDEFELLTQPETNILTYRYIPEQFRARVHNRGEGEPDNQAINEFNKRLQIAQRQEGRSFISRTTLFNTRYGKDVGITALRAVIANPLTTEDDLDATLDEQARLATSIFTGNSADLANGAVDY